ncbi:MAG: UDP-N-acetylmuramoyl-tripeptide--D-alanyl-D-alanine ligase [Bacteroidetes bacterium]|nr:UDP-N-acetylmuramoyl-tripeptide--D-alanyl-D-alanine ligase [Bacteroidota bacterium]
MNVEQLYQYFITCTSVTTDSRNCPEGSLFFALKGENFDGNKFALSSLERGCRYAVVDDEQYAIDSRFLLVGNCLEALQQLAKMHRRRLKTPVIGITGTNGKTTTKELIATVLSQKFNTLFTQGNFNNHIGVPLTLLQLKPEHEMAVIEMGANHPGEIKTLANIACPDFGIITNVGKAHLEGFGSFEGVIRTKGELYDYIRANGGSLFVNLDNPILTDLSANISRVGYAISSKEAVVKGSVISGGPFLKLDWKKSNEESGYMVNTNLIGEYNAENVLAAICIGLHFGVTPGQINRALEDYQPTNNRSQFKETEKNHLIIDAYNANPTSMNASIINFGHMNAAKKAVILGDMFELGDQSHQEHQKIVDLLEKSAFDKVILVGERFGAIPSDFIKIADTASLIAYMEKEQLSGYTVLVKGSHGMRLDKCVDQL